METAAGTLLYVVWPRISCYEVNNPGLYLEIAGAINLAAASGKRDLAETSPTNWIWNCNECQGLRGLPSGSRIDGSFPIPTRHTKNFKGSDFEARIFGEGSRLGDKSRNILLRDEWVNMAFADTCLGVRVCRTA